MSAPLENYLRTYRRRIRFTQQEIAFLIGFRSNAVVTRYERSLRRPDLRAAIAFEAIYRVPVSRLFAGLTRTVETGLRERAGQLTKRLADENKDLNAGKIAFLASVASPAERRS